MKILWIDCETTGFDEKRHAIIQLACILDDGKGNIIDELNLYMKPFLGDDISKDALEANGTTMEDLRSDHYMPPVSAFTKFIEFMSKYVNKYDSDDKVILAGKNVKFDIGFLRRLFDKCDDNYYGSWFHYPSIEVESEIAKWMVLENAVALNYKLETLCDHFEIPICDTHNGYEDIVATFKLYYKLEDHWLDRLRESIER